MSKNSQFRTSPPMPNPATLSLSIVDAEGAADLLRKAEVDVPDAQVSLDPSAAQTIDLPKAIRAAREAQARWDAGQQRHDKRALEQRARSEELDRKDRELRDSQRELESQKSEWRKQQEETKAAFVKREEDLLAREADAAAGFVRRKEEILLGLKGEITRSVELAAEQHSHYQQEVTSFREKLASTQAGVIAGLEEDRVKLAQQLREAERASREAQWLKEDLSEQKMRFEQQASDAVRSYQTEFQQRLGAAHERIEILARQVAEHDAAERAAGGLSVQQLLTENVALRKDRDQLRSELGTRATDEQTQRLQLLESENESLKTYVAGIRQKLSEAERLNVKQQIGVAELENLKDLKSAWECREVALRTANDQLRSELEVLTKRTAERTPFPELTKMDTDPTLQEAPGDDESQMYTDLNRVVQRARNAMAQQSDTRQSFYYSESDIRCFLGGLASNRLHLLQGISGTGKSSLPREFARVLGWQSAFVEVQSSWRDKTDLLGYFNAFEQRFYESTCLQALYKAQCPLYAKRPFLIVLDEMNLAQTEHYFADFLSALEQPERDRQVTLMTTTVNPHPMLLIGGKAIAIPANVWFIGTANHDESTKEFADKTYDRAHVMEFPRHPEKFSPERPDSLQALSWQTLQRLFDRAERERREDVSIALRTLEEELRRPLEAAGLGWGNRFEKQLSRFVPVVKAAGGSLHEALDHLLATKILRKIRGRYDLSIDDLKTLQDAVQAQWQKVFNRHPGKSAELIASEIRKLGQRE